MFSQFENTCIDGEGDYWLMWSWVALFVFVSFSVGPIPNCTKTLQVVYGQDDRLEPVDFAPQSQVANWVESVAMVVDQNALSQVDAFNVGFVTHDSLAETMSRSGKPLCASEPFALQPVFDGICSAFLVAPDKIVTAAHCINKDSCPFVAFVFGVGYSNDNRDISKVSSSNVYSCKKIIKRVRQPQGADFAIIETDRPVVGRAPLWARRKDRVSAREELILIGNPIGLPTKIARNGRVLDNDSAVKFKASTDSYGGQSGSPVIGARSKVVEGMLISGAQDFEKTSDGCWISKRCAMNGSDCSGETILRATEFSQYLDSN